MGLNTPNFSPSEHIFVIGTVKMLVDAYKY